MVTCRFVVPMTTEPHNDAQRELTRRLFYLITRICENGAQHASEGQSRSLDPPAILDLTNKLHSAGQSLTMLADAARLLEGGEI